MGRRRLLPLLLAVLAAVAAADELEKPAGEAQQVELAGAVVDAQQQRRGGLVVAGKATEQAP